MADSPNNQAFRYRGLATGALPHATTHQAYTKTVPEESDQQPSEALAVDSDNITEQSIQSSSAQQPKAKSWTRGVHPTHRARYTNPTAQKTAQESAKHAHDVWHKELTRKVPTQQFNHSTIIDRKQRTIHKNVKTSNRGNKREQAYVHAVLKEITELIETLEKGITHT